jgi:hypothetical protein
LTAGEEDEAAPGDPCSSDQSVALSVSDSSALLARAIAAGSTELRRLPSDKHTHRDWTGKLHAGSTAERPGWGRCSAELEDRVSGFLRAHSCCFIESQRRLCSWDSCCLHASLSFSPKTVRMLSSSRTCFIANQAQHGPAVGRGRSRRRGKGVDSHAVTADSEEGGRTSFPPGHSVQIRIPTLIDSTVVFRETVTSKG